MSRLYSEMTTFQSLVIRRRFCDGPDKYSATFLAKKVQKCGHSAELITAITGVLTIGKPFKYVEKEKIHLLINYC